MKIKTQEVLDPRGIPNKKFFRISAETLQEAVASNVKVIAYRYLADKYKPIDILEFEVHYRESIFGGTGGVVAIIATTAIDTRNQKAPIQVVEAWIHASEEDVK